MATTQRPDQSTPIDGPRGVDLLNRPILNKGTAFPADERVKLGLHGLLPPQVETLDEQAVRAYEAYRRKDDDLERHIYLRALQDTNEVLFYRLLLDHIEEMTPTVYTPVVAQACEQFSHIYRRPRGLFLSYPLRDSIPALLQNRPHAEVDVIVVTDGERILGIGDQGAGGLGIPIGKLSLYTLIGGIRPERTLPIVLDVGTNNPERLHDPEYLGWRHERVTGPAYFDFVDQFVRAVQQELPNTCLQWEDFATPHARPILERYRDELLTFNDDIQGTAAVALGAILGAVGVTGKRLRDQQIVFLGAGSAAVGVADYLRAALVQDGLSESEARGRFWLVDKDGLLHEGRTDLTPDQRVYAQPDDRVAGWPRTSHGTIGLADVIGRVEATILIGLSTVAGAFTEAIVREMARKVERPVILPLSNPTARSEASPEDLIRWTAGRALVATGSPYPPVPFEGRTIPIAQCNNVFIFPAVGLGVVASAARRVTDGMMLAAARALGEHSPARTDPSGSLLPALRDVRGVARAIATAVGQEAQRAGLAPETSPEELRDRIAAAQWTPEYPRNVPGEGVPVPGGPAMTATRVEHDSLGPVDVPADKLWGAQTQRSLEHFSIGDDLIPREMIPAYAIVKEAAALVNHKAGRLGDADKELIVRVCDEIREGQHRDQFPLHVWMTGSGTQFNMNVNEVIANRCSQIAGQPLGSHRPVHPNDHVNMAQSSNDSFPTAMNVAAAIGVKQRLMPAVEALRDALDAKARGWADIIKIGRTHLQDATPLTLGQEFSGYAGMLDDDLGRLEQALGGVYRLALRGTAVGTGLNAPPGFDNNVAAEIAQLTGLPFVTAPNKFAVQGAHDDLVQLSATLKTLAVSLFKIANDIRLLSCGPRAGLAELTIPANEPGSSIMPGKVNPTQCEALAMIAVQVMANDVATAVGGAGGYLEMNVYKPLLIFNIAKSVRTVTDGCANFRKFLVEGTEPNLERIGQFVERSLMLVTALSPVIGYDKASRVAHYALERDLTLKEAALQLGAVSPEEFDRIVDPRKMVRPYVATN